MPRTLDGERCTGGGRDAGATVLELLAGTLALGVLAAVTVPQYQPLQRLAWTTVATADARQAALLTAATTEGIAPAAPLLLSDPAGPPAEYADFRPSAGVGTAVVGVAASASAPAGSCVLSHHPRADVVLFDSEQGPLRRDPATGDLRASAGDAPPAASAPCARLGAAGVQRLLRLAGG